MLMNQRIVPTVAERHGYEFVHRDIDGALQSIFDTDANDDEPEPAPASVTTSDQPEPSAPVKLLAIAVDGTLLRSDGRIPEGVVHACRAAERLGCVVVIATSRPPRAVRSIIQTLDMHGPAITFQGALIWNPVDQRPQFHEALSSDIAGALIRDARDMYAELAIAIEVLDGCYTDRADALLDGERFLEPDAVAPLDELLDDHVTRVTVLGSPEQISGVAEMARERYWRTEQVAMFVPDSQAVQFTSRLVDKSIALQRIANRLGADRAEVMAIGDGVNDLGMLEWAGFGAAVANAVPAARGIADAVVPSNDDQGVVRAIQRYRVDAALTCYTDTPACQGTSHDRGSTKRPRPPGVRAAIPVAPSSNVWLNGRLVHQAEATLSVFDHGVLYGDGCFEGIRVYNGRIFKLASHLRRMYESAREAIRLEPRWIGVEEIDRGRSARHARSQRAGREWLHPARVHTRRRHARAESLPLPRSPRSLHHRRPDPAVSG